VNGRHCNTLKLERQGEWEIGFTIAARGLEEDYPKYTKRHEEMSRTRRTLPRRIRRINGPCPPSDKEKLVEEPSTIATGRSRRLRRRSESFPISTGHRRGRHAARGDRFADALGIAVVLVCRRRSGRHRVVIPTRKGEPQVLPLVRVGRRQLLVHRTAQLPGRGRDIWNAKLTKPHETVVSANMSNS
jgi:hypothetical protein